MTSREIRALASVPPSFCRDSGSAVVCAKTTLDSNITPMNKHTFFIDCTSHYLRCRHMFACLLVNAVLAQFDAGGRAAANQPGRELTGPARQFSLSNEVRGAPVHQLTPDPIECFQYFAYRSEPLHGQNFRPSALLRKRVSGDMDRQASANVSMNFGLQTCLLLKSIDVPRSFIFRSSMNSWLAGKP